MKHNVLKIHSCYNKHQKGDFILFTLLTFFYLSTDGLLGCFDILELQIMLIRTWVCTYFFEIAFKFFRDVFNQSEVAELYGNFTFKKYLRNYHKVCDSICTIFTFPLTTAHRSSVSSCPYQPWLYSLFFFIFDGQPS